MVYCGKPSKSCAECRRTRRKCDRDVPSCSQCIRAGKICQGYRDTVALLFRDQTQKTAAQVQQSKLAEPFKVMTMVASRSKEALGEALIQSYTTSESQLLPSFATNLTTNLEERATCYFFYNYVIDGSDNRLHMGYQYLKTIYLNEVVSSTMTDAIVALGLAGIANTFKDRKIMISAASRYNAALQSVNKALEDTEEAKKDQTLGAVMLLSLYETNTCTETRNIEAWRKHILGATTLMTLRGQERLQSPVGRQLFTQLRIMLIINCLQSRRPVPQYVQEWSDALNNDHDLADSDATPGTLAVVTKFCRLRASMSSFHDYSNQDQLIAELLSLDAEMVAVAANLTPEFLYTIECISEATPEVYSDHYHRYSNIWVANTWNQYRVIRLLINEMLLDQLQHLEQLHHQPTLSSGGQPAPTSGTLHGQILSTRSLLVQLMSDLCASVPYHLNYRPTYPSQPLLSSPYPGTSAPPDPSSHPRAVVGNILIWPLFSLACNTWCTPIMRTWIVGRLRVVAQRLAISQADVLAQLIVTAREFEVLEKDAVQFFMAGKDGLSLDEDNSAI